MEKWKFVQKTNGKKAVEYWISDQGRLKSVYTKSGKFIIRRGSPAPSGYMSCALGWIHRLVAKAFVPNPLGLPEIDHIDADPSNNAASNLRWCTHRQNMRNPQTLAKMRTKSATRQVIVVQQLTPDGELIKEWKSIRAVARAFGVSSNRFCKIVKRKNPIWRGFKWSRIEKEVPRYQF